MSHLLAGYYIHFQASTTACQDLVLLHFVNLLFCFWLVKHRLIPCSVGYFWCTAAQFPCKKNAFVNKNEFTTGIRILSCGPSTEKTHFAAAVQLLTVKRQQQSNYFFLLLLFFVLIQKPPDFPSGHRHPRGFNGSSWLLKMPAATTLTVPLGITAAAVRRSPFSMSRGVVLSWNPSSGSV